MAKRNEDFQPGVYIAIIETLLENSSLKELLSKHPHEEGRNLSSRRPQQQRMRTWRQAPA